MFVRRDSVTDFYDRLLGFESQSPHFGVQTFLPQQEGVEGHVVDAEVEEALPRHTALPAAAGVVRHQLLRRREAEAQLKLHQRLPELLRVVLLRSLSAPGLLRDEALQRRSGTNYFTFKLFFII